jgi:AcrR family transcriptional regulator
MARPTDPEIQVRLRAAAIDHVLAHGMLDLSLRSLANALGTSARMLVYHFGSREGLMREILVGLRERENARIRTWLRQGTKPRTMAEFLRWYWKRISASEGRSAARVIFELYALALRHPADYPGVLGDPIDYWRGLTQSIGVKSALRDAEATLLLATMRGLLLDFCATGNRARTSAAMELLVQSVARQNRKSG